MKTPMQELIERYQTVKTRLKAEPQSTSREVGIAAVESFMDVATELLEKEKKCIIDAYYAGKKEMKKPHKLQRTWLQYYNETFK